jgi:hypothetical protein
MPEETNNEQVENLYYEGESRNGKHHGKGILYYPNRQICYDGEWKDGKRHGKGTSYYSNGKFHYIGEWKDDKYDGKGTSYYPDGKIHYIGEWKDGKYDGKGNIHHPSGKNRYNYIGEWKDGILLSKNKDTKDKSLIVIKHSGSNNLNFFSADNCIIIDEKSTDTDIETITKDSIKDGKLRIAINTEGIEGKLVDEDWIKNKVDQIINIVSPNKGKASALTVHAMDIELYNSGGDAYVAENPQSASAIFLKIANKAGVPFTMTYVQNDGNRFVICNQGDLTPGTNPSSPEASEFMTSQQPSTFMTRF